MNNVVENIPFPFPMYNEHFKVICVVEDKMYYKKLKVKCVNCPGTKELTIDTRSNSNIRKHLSVSTGQYQVPTYLLSIIITIIINNWLFNLQNQHPNILADIDKLDKKRNVDEVASDNAKKNKPDNMLLDFISNKKTTSQGMYLLSRKIILFKINLYLPDGGYFRFLSFLKKLHIYLYTFICMKNYVGQVMVQIKSN